MDIHLLEFEKDGASLVYGMNHEVSEGRAHINLFRLEENKGGAPLDGHLWGIRDYLLSEVFPDADKDKTDWTLTSGYVTSDVVFEEIGGNSVQLKLSNDEAIDFIPFTLARYAEQYLEIAGRPMHQSDLLPHKGHPLPVRPLTVFAVPCPVAKDGVFYCKPEFFQGNIHNEYAHFIADTAKLLERVEQDNPEMIEHADYKFSGETAEDWLEENSLKHPYKTGSFKMIGDNADATSGTARACFETGNAGMLILMQKLYLPFIPLGVEKTTDSDKMIFKHFGAEPRSPQDEAAIKQCVKDLRNEIGYLGSGSSGPALRL